MRVKEEVVDAQYCEHLVLSAYTILRRKGGSGCGSSSLIPSSLWEGLRLVQMEMERENGMNMSQGTGFLVNHSLDLAWGSGDNVGGKGTAAEMGDEAGERAKEKVPEKLKQAPVCLFCRERKIVCEWPKAGSDDPMCK